MDSDSDNEGPIGGARRDTMSMLRTILALRSGGVILRTADGTTIDVRDLLRREGIVDTNEDEDEDEDYYGSGVATNQWIAPHTEPQEAGIRLLESGDFGRVGIKMNPSINITRKIMTRHLSKPRPTLYKEDLISHLVPNSSGSAVAQYDDNIYTAQYSNDSSFYYTCSQGFDLHIYDTTAPLRDYHPRNSQPPPQDPNLRTRMQLKNRIRCHPGRWTITDANLSPGNERMIYSSIMSTAYLTSTTEADPAQIPIPFGDHPRRRGDWDYENFGIWSCRFSADGNEIVAGGNGHIFVYDLLANRRSVKISAHNTDVNSCCWADTASGNVLVSASDDTFIKVWDRRSLGSSQKPSGVLVGHTEGITYVSAKGDGRYIISNGKDQALRLWDLRKMHSSQEFDAMPKRHYGSSDFDYRYPHYPKPRYSAHPKDCSVMTYRGHSVLRTLIRCHFSPGETTGGKYIYSGSADGKIHVWSLDGTIVQVLDRKNTMPMTFDPSEPERPSTRQSTHAVVVRDVSWHSQQPVLMSAGWDNHIGGSVVARHEWKGLLKMQGNLEDWVQKNREEEQTRQQYSRTMPGSFSSEDMDVDIDFADDEDDEDDEDYVP